MGIMSEETKFTYCCVVICEISNLYDQTPNSTSYTTLKARLLKRYTLTSSKRDAQLLDIRDLNNQRPSDLYSKLCALNKGRKDAGKEYLLKEIFLRALPSDIRAHLNDQANQLSLADLAKQADTHFTTMGDRICSMRNAAQPA